MARIPTFQSTTRVSGMPGVRQSAAGASPEAFGAAEGAALSRLGQEMNQIGQEIKSRQDKIAAKEAFSMASDELRVFLHDPQKGAYAKQGGNARGLAEQAETELQKIQDKAAKDLNPMQREMFESFWASQRESALTGVARHEADQMRVHEEKMDAAIVAGAEEDMVSHFKDPKAMKESARIAEATIRSQAARGGWSNRQTEAALTASRSRSYGAVIARYLVAGEIENAEKILAEHGDKLDAKVRLNLQAEIEQKSVQVFGEATANAMAPFGTSPDKEGEVLAELNKKYQAGEMNYSKYQAAEKAIQARFIDLSRIKDREAKAEYKQGLDAIRQSPGFKSGEDIAKLAKDPEIVDNLIRFNQIWHKDEYERAERAKAISNSIAASQAGRRAQESVEDQESLTLQTEYEKALTEVGGDPVKVQAYIGANYKGIQEEKLRRYAHNRDIMTPPTPKQTPAAPFEIGVMGQEAMNRTMAWFDREVNAGRKPSAQDTSLYLMRVSGPNARNILTRADAEFIDQYVAQNGQEGFVSSEKVADAIQSVTGKKTATSEEALNKYPDIYRAVLARMGKVNKPASVDQLKPYVSDLIAEYNKTKPWFFGKGEALTKIAQVKKEMDTKEVEAVSAAFGDIPSTDQLDFLREYSNRGGNLSQETPESLKAGFLLYQNKKKQGTKK